MGSKEATEKAAAEELATAETEVALASAEKQPREATANAEAAAKLAVDAASAASDSAGEAVVNTKEGMARHGIVVPAPGQLTTGGPGIKQVSGHATGPGEVQVLITGMGSAVKTLERKAR